MHQTNDAYRLYLRRTSIFKDKHRIKIGEPDSPVASAERGRQVIVHSGISLQAAYHDFTKFSIIAYCFAIYLKKQAAHGILGM